MPKGSRKRRKREDEAQAAVRVIETIAGRSEQDEEPEIEITDAMRAAAAAFGRIGGKIGGPARAAKLTARRRSEIARRAAASRWNQK
jgi:hypothetical protein